MKNNKHCTTRTLRILIYQYLSLLIKSLTIVSLQVQLFACLFLSFCRFSFNHKIMFNHTLLTFEYRDWLYAQELMKLQIIVRLHWLLSTPTKVIKQLNLSQAIFGRNSRKDDFTLIAIFFSSIWCIWWRKSICSSASSQRNEFKRFVLCRPFRSN